MANRKQPLQNGESNNPQKARFFPWIFARESESAKNRSLRITIIYFIVGCSWILFSDKIAETLFVQQSNIQLFSIIKGLVYVLLTSLLIYSLTYPAIKRALDAQETIRQVNVDLETSAKMYKGLFHEFQTKQSLLKSLIDSIPDLIFYKNTQGVFVGCNKAFETFVGQPEHEIIGKTEQELFPEEIARIHLERDAAVIASNATHISERPVPQTDGSFVVYETLNTPYYDLDGTVIGLIGVSRNISERKKREEEIQYLNYHDVMTGLYNRAYFQNAQIELDAPEYLPLSVIMGDVNGLKLINDAMGHTAGDNLLIEIANILRKCCRKDDVIARVGGDEYAILLPNTDAKAAWAVIERINAACAEYALQEDKKVVYTNIALGYATKTNMDEPLEQAMRSAEEFMYRRKLLEYKSFHNSILSAIKSAMTAKTPEASGHEDRIVQLCKKFGHAIGLSEGDLVQLELAASLHDIGTISIDGNILNKPGALSDEDWRAVKKHPEIGFRIANTSPELKHIAELILCHHERWDGTGYPQKLSKEQIPQISRIIAIVDAFDAMTQPKPYRKAKTPAEALGEIASGSGAQFDPVLAGIFIKMMQTE